MSIINAYGLDIHDSKNKKATHTSGGHTVYRTLINCMIAKNLSMFFVMHYAPNRTEPITMYNIGAKFASDKTLINRSLQVNEKTVYPTEGVLNKAVLKTNT